ncbi:hypothetical protein D8B26_002687 [Coccidioides posadasii str. Silveira]|uniref:Uncharacterized protein n=2 Tax=Coccidioides posadasii TaxID=199306 RepID=E9CYM2_COCPS|nr:conserved hypothetical protein [Coccidioides posadasii str. Silveira]KMM66737.1 MitM [Coccidioides posadasii RMSCC 3488]QVM07992.1 hypothetical protein D8B26_002687 [Coccidioides posadasii str. Silveira]
MATSEEEPLIDENAPLQSYYASLESRVGYRLFLGGTRHFGYYDPDTLWPFPIGRALRKMEDHLARSLDLFKGARALDAGCGYGHVAIHMARKHHLEVTAIDVVDRHVARAQRNVAAAGLRGAIVVQKADYHHLDSFSDSSFDGVYTMETFVHATDPAAALAGFFRVLKPGGSIALYEYDHAKSLDAAEEMVKMFDQVNTHAAMPSNALFEQGRLPSLLEDAGFVDVKVADLSENIKPMLRLFFVVAYIPYLIIRLFGLEAYFINAVAAVMGYRYHYAHRYVAVTAKKPLTAEYPTRRRRI